MNCLCEKDSGLFSSHSTAPYVLGCPSWATSEFEVQRSSMSRSLSSKVDVLPQQCHNSKTFNFQFQEQDASSTKSTDQSYPEVGTVQSGIWIETLPFCINLNVCAYQLVFDHFFLLLVYIFPTVKL